MTLTPPIFVIHRAQDEARAKFVAQAYAQANLDYSFFEATDGHADLSAFKPYQHLIGDHFWRDDEIKLGALACYISHYRLWKKIVADGIDLAIITEDDTAPASDFHTLWTELAGNIEEADVTFINNRTASLAKGKVCAFSEVAPKILEGQLEFRAPGADAYVLTQKGAQKLIQFADEFKVIFGVDWAIFGASWDMRDVKMRDLKVCRDMKLVFKSVGERENSLNTLIAPNALFSIQPEFKSTLVHKRKMPIDELKKDLTRL